MTVRVIPRLEDHLWYPILVKASGGGCVIREMQGKSVNEWNDMVRQQWEQDTKGHLKGCRI